jgi:hypothetical protein
VTTSPPRHGSGTASACRHGAAPPPRQILPSDAVACVRSIRCRRPCAVRHRPYGCYGAVVPVSRGSGSCSRHSVTSSPLTVWCVQELGEHRSRCSASFPCLCKNALLSLCSYSLLRNLHVRSKHVLLPPLGFVPSSMWSKATRFQQFCYGRGSALGFMDSCIQSHAPAIWMRCSFSFLFFSSLTVGVATAASNSATPIMIS